MKKERQTQKRVGEREQSFKKLNTKWCEKRT